MERAGLKSFIYFCLLAGITSGCASGPALDAQEQFAANPNRISAQLMTQRYLFESCRSITGSERLDGTLVVRFRVQANGRASDPHVFETIGQSSTLDRCLNDAALNLQFDPMPRGLVAEVEYPMQFNPGSRLPASAVKHSR